MTQFTRLAFSGRGFEGWVAFNRLLGMDICPRSGGVYVVARTSTERPVFTEESCGGWFKGKNPTVFLDVLRANWVDEAEVVYIGKANDLRRRLGEFARFGEGKPVGHWGGRLIWQLVEAPSLIVGWKTTPDHDPSAVEAELIADFRSAYGKSPFANNPHMFGR